MKKEDVLRAVDEAFAEGVRKMFAIFVEGLEGKTDPAELAGRFRRGLGFHCDAHAKTSAVVESYFAGLKP